MKNNSLVPIIRRIDTFNEYVSLAIFAANRKKKVSLFEKLALWQAKIHIKALAHEQPLPIIVSQFFNAFSVYISYTKGIYFETHIKTEQFEDLLIQTLPHLESVARFPDEGFPCMTFIASDGEYEFKYELKLTSVSNKLITEVNCLFESPDDIHWYGFQMSYTDNDGPIITPSTDKNIVSIADYMLRSVLFETVDIMKKVVISGSNQFKRKDDTNA